MRPEEFEEEDLAEDLAGLKGVGVLKSGGDNNRPFRKTCKQFLTGFLFFFALATCALSFLFHKVRDAIFRALVRARILLG